MSYINDYSLFAVFFKVLFYYKIFLYSLPGGWFMFKLIWLYGMEKLVLYKFIHFKLPGTSCCMSDSNSLDSNVTI